MTGNPANSEMLYRELGRTGEQVSAIGLGGWHLSLKHVDEDLAIRLVRVAIDRGITFMDNCWDYNDGVSELRMGKALRDGYREKVFLMTKIDGRSKTAVAGARGEFEPFKTLSIFDGTAQHPAWLGEEPQRLQQLMSAAG